MTVKTILKDKIAIISGNRGNLGPIWESALKSWGAEVCGFDWDGIARDEKDEKYNPFNVNVQDFISLQAFKNYYYKNHKNPPYIIINNAAIDVPPCDPIRFFTNYRKTIDTNLVGALRLTELFIDDMCEKKEGLIINIGSIQGNVAADWRNYPQGFQKPVGYNVSKAGLIQFTRSVAVQYGSNNIRSVCLSFGAVDTEKFTQAFRQNFLHCLPLREFISPESLRAALKFAIECPQLTGQQILVDSGYTSW